MNIKEGTKKYILTALLAILRELSEELWGELALALREYADERKTPDGWTKEEYLTYAIGRLTVLKSKDIGPWLLDDMIDEVIEWIIEELGEKLDDEEAHEVIDDTGMKPPVVDTPPDPGSSPPVIDPPVDHTPAPVPTDGPRYEEIFDKMPHPAPYAEGDTLWWKQATKQYMVLRGAVGWPNFRIIGLLKAGRWNLS